MKEENLYGVDISEEMAKLAGRFCKNVQVGSIYHLPYHESSFDLITASSALHHIEELHQGVSEIYRVLKQGGVFITDYDNNFHFAWAEHNKNRLIKIALIYPIFLKIFRGLFGRKNIKPGPKKSASVNIEKMGLEELHAFAEPQNTHDDGVNVIHLMRLLKKVGFKKTRVFTYHSARWNEGKPFSFINSLSNNKIYSISEK